MKIRDRVKKLRKKMGLTRKAFAGNFGISQRTLTALERNEYKPGYDLLLKICKIAGSSGKSIQWLMYGDEESGAIPTIASEPKSVYESSSGLTPIPVINEVPAGYPGYPELEDEIRAFLYVPGVPQRCFGLVVRGESMLPELADQDIVVVDPAIKSVEKGKIGVFRVNGEATIKICMPLEEEKGYILQPRNPNFRPILIADESECTVIGKVIYKIVHCE